MSSPIDNPNARKAKNKSVRFPEGDASSARFNYEREVHETVEEIDYFSYGFKRRQTSRAGPSRPGPSSSGPDPSNPFAQPPGHDPLDSDDDDDEEEEEDEEEENDGPDWEMRQATRANTMLNRRYSPFSDDETSITRNNPSPSTSPIATPTFSVTPPTEMVLSEPPPAATRAIRFPDDRNVSGSVIEGALDISARGGGMTPGAIDIEDDDPLDREYRQRHAEVVSRLDPNHARLAGRRPVASAPVSPQLSPAYLEIDPVEESIGSIPLRTLDSKLNEVLKEQREEERQDERQDERRDDRQGGYDTPQIKRLDSDGLIKTDTSSDAASIIAKEKEAYGIKDDDQDEKKGRRSNESGGEQMDARQEAEDLADQLVKAHLRNQQLSISSSSNSRRSSTDAYVPNTAFLENAGTLDEDLMADDLRSPTDEIENDFDARADLELGTSEVAPPQRVRAGVLSSLLRLYADAPDPNKSQSTLVGSAFSESYSPGAGTPAITPMSSPPLTPMLTPGGETPPSDPGKRPKSSRMPSNFKFQRPSYLRSNSSEDALGRKRDELKHKRRWYENDEHKRNKSISSLGALASSSLHALATTPGGGSPHGTHLLPEKTDKRDKLEKQRKQQEKAAAKAAAKKLKKARLAAQRRITVHIADLLQRQRFLLRFGRALMLFGAPSHRLEEYLRMTARVLEVDASFLYMPGCMLISFGDVSTHTSETKIIRVVQGLNLQKLDATHLIYKEVVHDLMGLEEASDRIDELLRTKNHYPPWLSILFFALASGFIALYGFGGWWYDMPIAFVIGGIVGFLQIWVAPKSDLYSNVFEVSSSILASFLGRAFGSINMNGEHVFCFAALTQGSLALILPGYIILCGSLELQSKNLVAGAVRMFYAIVYSSFLAFGIALGAAIYGWMDSDASNEFTCHRVLDPKWRILFVPCTAILLALVNQASYRQLPVMVGIASAGYTVLYFIQTKIENASAFTSALGAFAIGILGNLYSRIGHGLAFAAMLPGIFVIVPSGVAAQGSLISGVALANQIVSNTTDNTTGSAAATSSDSSLLGTNSGVGNLGGTMVQVAVGITVGLFVATLVVYPLGLGKKRSGLFTF